jgi:hypothetical protein
MKWLKEHIIETALFIGQIIGIVIVASVAWGVISTKVEANTEAIKEVKDDAKLNRSDIVEMKGDIKTLLERTKNQ